jgi:hypothetical protein
VELLVGGAPGPQLELGDAVAREARVRMAVDEPRHRCPPLPVKLDDIGRQLCRAQLRHAPDGTDVPLLAEDVGVLDDPQLTERRST